ncbi:Beta-galactosidase, beta-sandwich domain [Dillenia turbinata]|uniref:beta-galactosidase n=1 Tax=Dillenia turbinata TaxID=194707 RepID=A0AAN8VN14_9MAGN
MRIKTSLVAIFLVVLVLFECEIAFLANVTYDGRALVIDGKRRVLQSGSIHYPRTTPDMWPEIIRKSKEGGLDVIETYVFWNYHEPEKGKYYFEGRFDLVKFVKTVQEAGLFVHLRIGPYACAEWNYGGFPMWLHLIPGIQFRTTNELFKNEMKSFLSKIVDLMKEKDLFASQGGPIILAQWAAETAINLNTSVPWVMCQQQDAPDPVINTCNGFYCDQFTPNSPTKPKMWTENYTGWFLAFGYAIPFRPAQDLAFAVARFFETGGTFQNYYMYFGGTNFGRTAGGPLIATSYDYDAPLDEYGFVRQPKWGHLRDLHTAIKQCEEYLVSSEPVRQDLGINLEAHIYFKGSKCAAFLANYDSSSDANVTFKGKSYFLPAWSVSILPDCKNVIFNTAKVTSHRNVVHSTTVSDFSQSEWSWYKETVGVWGNNSFVESGLLEQINTTKDISDFLWYTTSIHCDGSINANKDGQTAYMLIESLGHAALVFVNKKLVAFGYGYHDNASFGIKEKISLKEGNNTLDVLSMMIGLQNYGPWFDIQGAGLLSVVLADFGDKEEDLTSDEWTYQVGLEGEFLGLFDISLANSSLWTHGKATPVNQSLIWYKTTFLAPEGNAPLVLDLASMGKGQAWINGQSIGRYWPAYLSPSTGCTENCDYRGTYDSSKCLRNCGQPTQTLYYFPRTWLHPGKNLLVLHEELGGDPSKISLKTRTSEQVCGIVSEVDPPPVDNWTPDSEFTSGSPEIRLTCEKGWHISAINYASYGTPRGDCGTFTKGSCHADMLLRVQQACIGRDGCSISVSSEKLGDPCPGIIKSLAIEAVCSV